MKLLPYYRLCYRHLSRKVASGKIAFTLIELLVVIAIIAILAAMIFPIVNRVSINQTKAVARSQLNQVETAIKSYQARFGFYPPDNTNSVLFPPLYYELIGTRIDPNNPSVYVTLDGAGQITNTMILSTFYETGFANSSAQAKATDEGQVATSFLKDLKPQQIGTNTDNVKFLVCSAGPESAGANGNSRFRYNSSHPTNNPSSYDLWVDIYYGGKTWRFGNWAAEPQLAQ